MKLPMFLFSILFLIGIASALSVNIPTGVSAGNYSTITVNNSPLWDGHPFSYGEVSSIEADPIWTANSTLVPYLANNNTFTGVNNFTNLSYFSDIKMRGLFNNTMAANQAVGFVIDGETNPYGLYTTGTTAVQLRRKINGTTNNDGTTYTAFDNYLRDDRAFTGTPFSIAHTAIANKNSLFSYGTTDAVALASMTKSLTGISNALYSQDIYTGAGVFDINQYGTYSDIQDLITMNNVAGTIDYNAYGNYMKILSISALVSGTINKSLYGDYIWIQGDTTGNSNAYGLYIYSVAGADNNYGLYNPTSVNNLLGADNSKTFFGTGEDASFYYNGSDLICNPKEVGNGNLFILSNVTASKFIGDGSLLTGINGMNYTNLALTNQSNNFNLKNQTNISYVEADSFNTGTFKQPTAGLYNGYVNVFTNQTLKTNLRTGINSIFHVDAGTNPFANDYVFAGDYFLYFNGTQAQPRYYVGLYGGSESVDQQLDNNGKEVRNYGLYFVANLKNNLSGGSVTNARIYQYGTYVPVVMGTATSNYSKRIELRNYGTYSTSTMKGNMTGIETTQSGVNENVGGYFEANMELTGTPSRRVDNIILKLIGTNNSFMNGTGYAIKSTSIYPSWFNGSINTSSSLIGNELYVNGNTNISGNLFVGGNVSIKRPYAMFSDNTTQIIGSALTAQVVNFSTTEDNYEIVLQGNQNITFQQQGDYLIEVSAIYSVDTPNKFIEFWVQKTNSSGQFVNVPRSNTRMDLSTASLEIPLAVPFIIDVLTTDKIRFMTASEDAGSSLVYTTNSSYSPETPSIIVTLSKQSEITP